MINHNIPQFNLTQDMVGEMVLPSEKGNLIVSANLRQFIIQTRRNYNGDALTALQDSESINIVYNQSFPEDTAPYFYLKLTIRPDIDFKEFAVGTQGYDFFNKVLELAGHSNVRFKSGNRTAFVSAFEKVTDENLGEVLVSNILIGTSVFYNDYRVTLDFPFQDEEYQVVVGDFFRDLSAAFPTVQVQVSYEPVSVEANA